MAKSALLRSHDELRGALLVAGKEKRSGSSDAKSRVIDLHGLAGVLRIGPSALEIFQGSLLSARSTGVSVTPRVTIV